MVERTATEAFTSGLLGQVVVSRTQLFTPTQFSQRNPLMEILPQLTVRAKEFATSVSITTASKPMGRWC